MVSSEILFRLKTSHTLKCLLTTNFQFRALSGKKIQLVTSLNTSGTKKTINDLLQGWNNFGRRSTGVVGLEN